MSPPSTCLPNDARPPIVDTIQLRNIQLPLPVAPEAWRRSGKRQPCTATIRVSYASSVGAAEADDVTKTLDYGKLLKRVTADLDLLTKKEDLTIALGDYMIVPLLGTSVQDEFRNGVDGDFLVTASVIARSCLQILLETAVRVLIDIQALWEYEALYHPSPVSDNETGSLL